MFKILSLVCLLVLMACSSDSIKSPALNDPLKDIYTSVQSAMSMGIQGYSENRREIFSNPFLVRQTDEVKKNGFRERGRAKVIILGDERPYTVEVQVSIERGKLRKASSDMTYTFVRYDKRLGDLLLKDILAGLHRENRERNAIDDFQPF